VVDDEVAMVRSLELLLRPLGEVIKAYSVPEAEEVLHDSIDCIVTDVCMPEATGIELLDRVKKKNPDTPVIVMTAYSSVPQAVETMQRGAFAYVMKPFENKDLVASVRRAIEKKGQTFGESGAMPSGWVCNSEAMKNFLLKAEKAASTPGPILLVGEKGVGKRRAAQWMAGRHRPKAKKEVELQVWSGGNEKICLETPLNKIQCLYIEEVFNLSKSLQDHLVKILDEGRVFVVAGTSSDPQMQKTSDFRADLYDRLSVQVLRVPSLRERESDFEALVRHLVEQIRGRMKLKDLQVDSAALQELKSKSYVGNVKELERVLERSSLEAKRSLIGVSDLRFEMPDLSKQLPFSVPVEEGWGKLEYLHVQLERDLIERALKKYPEASNSQIAQILGTTRRILELRMKEYDLHSAERESS
jgi:two-component system NtrC family response regulator